MWLCTWQSHAVFFPHETFEALFEHYIYVKYLSASCIWLFNAYTNSSPLHNETWRRSYLTTEWTVDLYDALSMSVRSNCSWSYCSVTFIRRGEMLQYIYTAAMSNCTWIYQVLRFVIHINVGGQSASFLPLCLIIVSISSSNNKSSSSNIKNYNTVIIINTIMTYLHLVMIFLSKGC